MSIGRSRYSPTASARSSCQCWLLLVRAGLPGTADREFSPPRCGNGRKCHLRANRGQPPWNTNARLPQSWGCTTPRRGLQRDPTPICPLCPPILAGRHLLGSGPPHYTHPELRPQAPPATNKEMLGRCSDPTRASAGGSCSEAKTRESKHRGYETTEPRRMSANSWENVNATRRSLQ